MTAVTMVPAVAMETVDTNVTVMLDGKVVVVISPRR